MILYLAGVMPAGRSDIISGRCVMPAVRCDIVSGRCNASWENVISPIIVNYHLETVNTSWKFKQLAAL